MTRMSEDPTLRQAAGHANGCVCDECMRRMSYLDHVDAKVDAKIAREEEAREYDAVPLAERDREAARLRYASAIIEADRIGMARRKLRSNAESRLGRASKIASEHPFKPMPAEQYKGFVAQTRSGLDAAQQARELAEVEREYRDRAERARVICEPPPYGQGSPHSWIRDCLAMSDSDSLGGAPRVDGHQERLGRHAQDVCRAVRERSPYGRQIEAQWTAEARSKDPNLARREGERKLRELRALVTGGGSTVSAAGGAAAFVTPAVLMQAWADYRSPYGSFVSQCNDSIELPEYGLWVYLPSLTAGTSVTTYVENTGVSESDPVSALPGYQVVQKAGQVTVSQMVLDRVGPGITGDVLVWTQLKDQLAAQVDAYALATVLAGAQQVTNTGTFALDTASGEGGFLKDVKAARSKLTDTAGVRIRASHMFSTSDFADYLAALADAQGRPIFEPTLSSDANTDQGCTGFNVSGLSLWADDNIGLSGSNTQIILCRPSTILALNGPVIPYVTPQYGAVSLEPVVGVRQYVCCVPRWPQGVAVISGSAYTASTFA